MARPLRPHVPGVLCHVVCRGGDRQTIFTDDAEYRRYIELLGGTAARFRVLCVGFCLLDNHIHLVLRPQQDPLSRMMQQLNSTYCRWWNVRHDRVGHVLQGRFKLRLVGDELYRHHLVRYVMRNPVVAGCVRRVEDWRWSSYRATAGLEQVPEFLHVEDIWSMFPPTDTATPQQQFREFVNNSTDEDFLAPTLIAGTPDFKAQLEPRFWPHTGNPDFVYADKFAARPSLDDLFEGRAMPVEPLAKRAFTDYGYSLGEIGRYLRRPPSTVWTWIRRGVRSRSSKRLRKIEI